MEKDKLKENLENSETLDTENNAQSSENDVSEDSAKDKNLETEKKEGCPVGPFISHVLSRLGA